MDSCKLDESGARIVGSDLGSIEPTSDMFASQHIQHLVQLSGLKCFCFIKGFGGYKGGTDRFPISSVRYTKDASHRQPLAI